MPYDTLSEPEWEQVERVWDLLEDGDLERARDQADTMLGRRPGHPDVLVVDAAVSIEEGRPDRALQALRGAERSADPALFFHLRSLARYHRVDLEHALEDARKALTIRPGLAESHALAAKVLELLGDHDRAAVHTRTAEELDPEGFPAPLAVEDAEFDRLVQESLREFPAPMLERLEEIPVLVESLPAREILTGQKPPLSPDLLGLFVGHHLLERRHDDVPTSPGAIYLFRKNLLRVCRDREELAREIRVTVRHEVGHFLGLDEDQLGQWGLA